MTIIFTIILNMTHARVNIIFAAQKKLVNLSDSQVAKSYYSQQPKPTKRQLHGIGIVQ